MASGLIDRVRGAQARFQAEQTSVETSLFEQTKEELHAELIEALDFDQIARTPRAELDARLRSTLVEHVGNRSVPLNASERQRLVDELLDDILGLGPLEPLLKDPEVTDILVNGPHEVYVERRGTLTKHPVQFKDTAHLLRIIDRIVSAVGRRVDETSPMVDARLQDGSRVHVIIPPAALDGPVVSIRRFGVVPLSGEDLVGFGALPGPMLAFLGACVRARLNVVVSGGTGTGKTTMLNILSSFVSDRERIVTIEDAAELQLQQTHVVRLETRPPNVEGKGEITQRELLKNALRMRPDRILVGEVRAVEAIDMLQAMNTGHEGSMTTVHANSARDALARIETMVGLGMPNTSDHHIRGNLARALDLVVQLGRLSDGTRRVLQISEVCGIRDGDIVTTDLFVFEETGVTEDGRVRGSFRATGNRPGFAGRLQARGVAQDEDVYALREEVR